MQEENDSVYLYERILGALAGLSVGVLLGEVVYRVMVYFGLLKPISPVLEWLPVGKVTLGVSISLGCLGAIFPRVLRVISREIWDIWIHFFRNW